MKAIAASVVGVMVGAILATAVVRSQSSSLAARVESLAAFDERSIPASGVAPPSNTPGIATPPRKPRAAGAPVLSRRALPAGRLARLGATPGFQHGLPSRLYSD